LKEESENAEPKKPRTYQQSDKSKKTVASLMFEKPAEQKKEKPPAATQKVVDSGFVF
jgi:hypothetical protein